MKNRIMALVVGMVLLLFSSLLPQAPDTLWTRTYGGDSADVGITVQQTFDGGYVIAGGTGSFGAGGLDLYLIKTDSAGIILWTTTLGGTDADYGHSVLQTPDKGFIIAGLTSSFGQGYSDAWLIKTDPLGDTIWTSTFGGNSFDFARSIDITNDHGYILAGGTSSFGSGNYDFYLIKADSMGNMIWSKTYGGSDEDIAWSVQQTNDNGYIVGGYTRSFSIGGSAVYLVKTDSLGDTLWTKTYGDSLDSEGYSVRVVPNGGYVVTGTVFASGSQAWDVYLVRTNPNGDTLWTKAYGGGDWDFGYSVQETSDNGFIVAGETCSFGSGNGDYYLLKMNENGDTLWTQTFGGNAWDYSLSVNNTSDGGYILVGYTESFGMGSSAAYLIKTATDPTIVKEKQHHETKSRKPVSLCYPNPFTTVTSIELLGTRKNTKSNLIVYDASGRLVKSVKLASNTYELGADLVPGIYFLKLNGTPVGKVVKVR